MKKLFEIDENEKRRILEMHETATKNLYLGEQATQKGGCLAPQTRTDSSKEIAALGGESNLCKILGTSNNPLVGDSYYGTFYFKGYEAENGIPEVKVYKLNTKFFLREVGTFRYLLNQGWITTGAMEIEPTTTVLPKDGKIDGISSEVILRFIENTANDNRLDSTKYLDFLKSVLGNEFYKKTLEYIVNFSKTATSQPVKDTLTKMLQTGNTSELVSTAGLTAQ
jgi:hypothetical protein